MPGQQAGSPPGTITSSSYTADAVIKMFAELGLPVCDDGEAIKKKFEEVGATIEVK